MAADSSPQRLEVVSLVAVAPTAAPFDELYARHAERALRLAGLLCGHREQAEDTVAEAFVKVLASWRSQPIDNFWGYLRTAVVNEVRTGHRRRLVADRWRHRTHHGDRSNAAEDGVAEQQRVADALAALPERQRTAVVLRYFEDLSERQTADLMGCSVGAVKSTTSKGAARLRALLTEEES